MKEREKASERKRERDIEREREEREGGWWWRGPLEQTNGHIYYFTGGQHDYWIKITI